MSDLKSVLDLALDDLTAPPAHAVADADLVRGRRHLRRGRLARAAVPLAACTALGGWAISGLSGQGGPAGTTPTSPRAPVASAPATLQVALVAYHGTQVPGYQVAEVPEGWAIQGGDAYALTIAPRDAADKNYGSFQDKLVVMLESKDAPAAHEGRQVDVGGRPAWFTVEDDSLPTPTVDLHPGARPARPGSSTEMLTFSDAKGHRIVIQAPGSLGWDADRLARFAEGVTVLHNAEAGVG